MPFVQPRHGRASDLPPRHLYGLAPALIGTLAAVGLGRIWKKGSASEAAAGSTAPALGDDVRAVVREGYEAAPAAEQTGFNLLAAFTLTTASARLITYLRDQRRRIKPSRRLRGGGDHVHHFVPGIAVAFASGSAALLARGDRSRPWLALPFGTGMALTLDEAELLLELDDRYWSSERLVLAQTVLGLAGCIGLAARLTRRGERRALSA